MERIDEAIQSVEHREKEKILTVPLPEVSLRHIGRKVRISGIIRSTGAISPSGQPECFECDRCHRKYSQKQNFCRVCDGKFFHYREANMVNMIKAIISEDPSEIDLSRALVSLVLDFTTDLEKVIYDIKLGNKYVIEGTVNMRSEGKKSYFFIEVDNYTYITEGLDKIELSEQDIEQIKVFSNDPDRIEKIAKMIFGTDLSKLEVPMEAAILSMASGPERKVGKTLKNRGVIDILFVGSPARGKSQLLKRIANFFPKSRYASGSNASAIGLCASVRKDELIGDYVLEPGVVALCHPGGIACIDELDKVPKDDLTKLNTQMDSLMIPIDKANVHRSIPANVSIIAAMNPKHGAFSGESILGEIILKKEFQDRFDLIFNVDYFTKGVDSNEIAKKSLKAYKEEETEIDYSFIIKYFAYIRRLNPVLCGPALDFIREEYSSIVGKAKESSEMYLSLRLLDNITRLATAYSRLRLGDEVDMGDIKDAGVMLKESFKSLGVYEDKGLNVFTVERVVNPKKIKKADLVLEALKGKMLSFEEIQSITELSSLELEEVLRILLLKGDIFEPQRNKYKLY
jgi:DNA replicative helicase MCM subunit Mcm2 (Cdc46/Mcm family)